MFLEMRICMGLKSGTKEGNIWRREAESFEVWGKKNQRKAKRGFLKWVYFNPMWLQQINSQLSKGTGKGNIPFNGCNIAVR